MHQVFAWTGPITYRQHLLWNTWRRAQWNEPDKHDHYVMQATQMILARGGISRTLEQLIIPFADQPTPKKRLTKKERRQLAKRSMSVWKSVAGGKGIDVIDSPLTADGTGYKDPKRQAEYEAYLAQAKKEIEESGGSV